MEDIEKLIDKYREDIMLVAQGISSDNKQLRDSAISVGALSSLNLKQDLTNLINQACNQARIDELEHMSINSHYNDGGILITIDERIKELIWKMK